MWLYFQEINRTYEAKFTAAEFTMFSRHYGKKCNRLELLHWWHLQSKRYFRLLTWPKTIDKSNR